MYKNHQEARESSIYLIHLDSTCIHDATRQTGQPSRASLETCLFCRQDITQAMQTTCSPQCPICCPEGGRFKYRCVSFSARVVSRFRKHVTSASLCVILILWCDLKASSNQGYHISYPSTIAPCLMSPGSFNAFQVTTFKQTIFFSTVRLRGFQANTALRTFFTWVLCSGDCGFGMS